MGEEHRNAGQAVQFLMKTVMSALSEGLAKTADMPGNPVENLGNYLLAAEAHKEKVASAEKQQNHWLSEVEKFKANAPIAKDPEPDMVLPSADSIVALLMKVSELIKVKCAASAVYFGIVRPNEEAEGDEDNEIILYEASTVPEQLERMLVKGQGVVWDVLLVDEEEEEEDPENPRPPKERKVLHIPSLLINGPYRERVHFWDRPMTGAFVVMPLRYGSHLFAEALKAPLPPGWPEKPEPKPEPVEDEVPADADEAAPAEEAAPEEEAEVIPDPPTQPMTWIMCLDSTLTANDFSEHIPWLRSQASELEERLLKADQQEYLRHRNAEEKLEAAEDVSALVGEINNLSHLVHINKELLEKYYAIALSFGLDRPSLVLLEHGKPSWRKILAAFCTLSIPLEVEDGEALRALVDEVVESSPSALSKVLKVYSDSTIPPPAEPAPVVAEDAEPAE